MTCEEIKSRAHEVMLAFESERGRVGADPMCTLLNRLSFIASLVESGDYHRDGLFARMVNLLGELGFDVSEADREARSESESYEAAAYNAQQDTYSLWRIVRDVHSRATDEMNAVRQVVDTADDLMRAIGVPEHDMNFYKTQLHDAVTTYIDARKRKDDDAEIRRRAEAVRWAFLMEWERVDADPMEDLLRDFAEIAFCVSVEGAYHRAGEFRDARRALERLGFDVSNVPTEDGPRSKGRADAAVNARIAAHRLYMAVRLSESTDARKNAAHDVVSFAEDLMCAITDHGMDIARLRDCLHRVVSDYLDAIERERKAVRGECTRLFEPVTTREALAESEAIRRIEAELKRALREVRILRIASDDR